MNARDTQLEAIALVARGLGELADKVAFVGGATVGIYIDDPAVEDVRVTKDVDCVIEVSGLHDYAKLEMHLRRLGFTNVVEEGAPICRWRFSGVIVDVMPTDSSILGFSNRWYPEAMEHLRREIVADGIEIAVFELCYFIATKLEAFNTRGKEDWWASHDLEDIIALLDGCISVEEELSKAEGELRSYLQAEFTQVLRHKDAKEILSAHLMPTGTTYARVERISAIIERFIAE
ncbi:nucleotidyl transferase AbiEii/AbiGii toxin family protein [Myxococcota bacterium]|nr:nucleotidyl transferase AbiEii/AbiGii toxin family protein [Myxococcota bacterium]